MKNDKFPTTSMLVNTIKTALGENMRPYFLEGDRLRTNLLGELIDLGYDVLREVVIEEHDERVDLLVRLSDGFMPIKLCVNPENREEVRNKIASLSSMVNEYKDVRNGYLICLLNREHQIFDEEDRLFHRTDNAEIFWWGGRIMQDNDSATKQIEPIWTKEKLKVYGLRQREMGQQ